MTSLILLRRLACAALLFVSAGAAGAQSNSIPGLDVRLGELGPIQALGRRAEGGVNGVAFLTTACNVGTVTVPWIDGDSTVPMGDDHPWIAFLVARYDGQRLVQISDRSYVKAGFNVFAGNLCGQCSSCPGGICSFLAPGCSDTYSVSTNGESYFLAPPDEIDPFEVTWDPFGTHFDRGEPPVAPPFDTDGVRSLTQQMVSALGPVAHRVRVRDADLAVPGASFWFQGAYLVKGEPEAARANDLGSRGVVPTWAGTHWDLAATGPLQLGTVLRRWPGATVTSATNGASDGRVYVAVQVSGPTNGLYHYEYALHNRDNARGVRSFRLPLCSTARALGFEFRDIDGDPSNDWSFTRVGDELVVSTTSSPLRWNTIFNVAFDSDAIPGPGSAVLEAHAPGPGAASFEVATGVPGVLALALVAEGGGSAAVPPILLGPGGAGAPAAPWLAGGAPSPLPWSLPGAGDPLLGSAFVGLPGILDALPLPPAAAGLLQLGTVLLCPQRDLVPQRR